MNKRGNSGTLSLHEDSASGNKSIYGSPGFGEERSQAKTCKIVTKLIETSYIGEDPSYLDAKMTARRMLQEAMKLVGIMNFEPTTNQINLFIQNNDLDRDGKISLMDIEDKVLQFQGTDSQYFSNSAVSAKSAGSTSPLQNERMIAQKTAIDKLGDKAVEVLVIECRKCFNRYDTSSSDTIEYDGLLPLLTDVYSVFGVNFRPNSQEAKRYVDIIDSDKDGQISWSDFELFVLKVLANMETSVSSSK
jgi:Ca2+-binding EF-hand superfamily protein